METPRWRAQYTEAERCEMGVSLSLSGKGKVNRAGRVEGATRVQGRCIQRWLSEGGFQRVAFYLRHTKEEGRQGKEPCRGGFLPASYKTEEGRQGKEPYRGGFQRVDFRGWLSTCVIQNRGGETAKRTMQG